MNRVFIIAEAGVNHNGSLDLAKRLIRIAADAGADAVKFQTFQAGSLVSKTARKAEYQERETGTAESQYEMLKRLELDPRAHADLQALCRESGIAFMSTPFDPESIKLLHDLGMDIFKIPSGEITNLPHLRQIGALGKRVILSTGMSTMDEVGAALDALAKAGTPLSSITVLHATTEYPAPMDEVNLLAMPAMREAFGVEVGYSDHTPGIEIPIAAAAMGARVIEKHFTLDRTMPGPDHKASLEPDELIAMVSAIRNLERAMGDGAKTPTASERKNMMVARKSIVAARPISKGETFTAANLAVKRPGTGISPMRWDEFLGKIADRDFREDEPIC